MPRVAAGPRYWPSLKGWAVWYRGKRYLLGKGEPTNLIARGRAWQKWYAMTGASLMDQIEATDWRKLAVDPTKWSGDLLAAMTSHNLTPEILARYAIEPKPDRRSDPAIDEQIAAIISLVEKIHWPFVIDSVKAGTLDDVGLGGLVNAEQMTDRIESHAMSGRVFDPVQKLMNMSSLKKTPAERLEALKYVAARIGIAVENLAAVAAIAPRQ